MAERRVVTPLAYEPVVLQPAPARRGRSGSTPPSTGTRTIAVGRRPRRQRARRVGRGRAPGRRIRPRPPSRRCQRRPRSRVTTTSSPSASTSRARRSSSRPRYFPNWQASGADGPLPRGAQPDGRGADEHEVRLHYGHTPVDGGAWLLTALGVAGLVVLRRRPRAPFPPAPPGPGSGPAHAPVPAVPPASPEPVMAGAAPPPA